MVNKLFPGNSCQDFARGILYPTSKSLLYYLFYHLVMMFLDNVTNLFNELPSKLCYNLSVSSVRPENGCSTGFSPALVLITEGHPGSLPFFPASEIREMCHGI